jgi:transcriptional regulator with XRE-family HTH domain
MRKPRTDVAGIVLELRKARYPSRKLAAETLGITPEGLRKIEKGARLLSRDLISEMIQRWNLTVPEGEELRFAVHTRKQERDGYASAHSREAMGFDIDTALAATVGGVTEELRDMLGAFSDDDEDKNALLEEFAETLERHVRANFR